MTTAITVPPVTLDPEMARKLSQAGRKLEEWHAERDRLIVLAHRLGAGYREIGRAVGLSHVGVKGIVEGFVNWDEYLEAELQRLRGTD